MFDWLFKRTKPKKYKFEPMDDEIARLYKKINSVKSSCLDDDKKIIEPLKKRIDELNTVRNDFRRQQKQKAIDELNTFPLHTPCTLSYLSDALNIDWLTLHEVMYSRKPSHRIRPQYVLSIDNWQEVKYDLRTYLERIE